MFYFSSARSPWKSGLDTALQSIKVMLPLISTKLTLAALLRNHHYISACDFTVKRGSMVCWCSIQIKCLRKRFCRKAPFSYLFSRTPYQWTAYIRRTFRRHKTKVKIKTQNFVERFILCSLSDGIRYHIANFHCNLALKSIAPTRYHFSKFSLCNTSYRNHDSNTTTNSILYSNHKYPDLQAQRLCLKKSKRNFSQNINVRRVWPTFDHILPQLV